MMVYFVQAGFTGYSWHPAGALSFSRGRRRHSSSAELGRPDSAAASARRYKGLWSARRTQVIDCVTDYQSKLTAVHSEVASACLASSGRVLWRCCRQLITPGCWHWILFVIAGCHGDGYSSSVSLYWIISSSDTVVTSSFPSEVFPFQSFMRLPPISVDRGVMLLGNPAWGRGTPFPPLLLPCPFTSSSFALYYLFPFFSHPLYLSSSTVHPIPFYQNSPTLFPGVRS